ncbi:hypothetical protein STEG23_006189, partial [Scotinomys teguina]
MSAQLLGPIHGSDAAMSLLMSMAPDTIKEIKRGDEQEYYVEDDSSGETIDTVERTFKAMTGGGAKDFSPVQPSSDHPKHPVTMHMVRPSLMQLCCVNVFETGVLYVPVLPLNSKSSCLSLRSTGLT